jgi:hypothetical protein
MPFRIPRVKIVMSRKGVRFAPEIGKQFDFTSEEIADITSANPDALDKVTTSNEIGTGNKTDDAGNEKVALAERATELGLTFAKNISVAKLKEIITEAENAKTEADAAAAAAAAAAAGGNNEGGDL